MNLDYVTEIMGEEPDIETYNNGKQIIYSWDFDSPFNLVREFLQGYGWKEDDSFDNIIETSDWSIDYWYHLIDPKGIKCYVEGNLYYGGIKLVYNEGVN